jgi:uncharacterized protein YndB with AHSA1/START domain
MNIAAGSIAAIERQIELDSDLERVWAALTEPAQIGSWFANGAAFEPRAGADGWLEWTEHGRFAIRVEAVEAPTRFSFRWARDPDTAIDDGPSTLVEIELRPGRRGGTALHLRESGFRDPDSRTENVGGWFGMFELLSTHLAREPWQAGIHRTYTFRSSPERMWRAFAEPDQFRVWFGGEEPVEIRTGADGWLVWPSAGGRYAIRVEVAEPVHYLCWRWAIGPDVSIEEAAAVLQTEWLFEPSADGGTVLRLLETGFTGPGAREGFEMNSSGWDSDVIPGLRKVLGEA